MQGQNCKDSLAMTVCVMYISLSQQGKRYYIILCLWLTISENGLSGKKIRTLKGLYHLNVVISYFITRYKAC